MLDENFSVYLNSKYRHAIGEQETKNTLIEPFFKELGYDIRHTEDIMTEVTCDIGKNNEKVDYILCIAGQPKILVEAKDWRVELSTKHINQLFRYFSTSDCKLGILTNGLEYWFFSDFEKENVMDKKPFYKINALSICDKDKFILNAICKVQQCAYPIEKFIIEQKTRLLMKDKEKLSKIIALTYFNNLNNADAVYNGLRNDIK